MFFRRCALFFEWCAFDVLYLRFSFLHSAQAGSEYPTRLFPQLANLLAQFP